MRECGFSAALSAGGQPALSANPGPPCTLSLFLTTKKMPSLAAGGRWRASQDKEIFRLSHSSPTPLPLITMIGGAVPVQQNAAEVQPGKVVTLGSAAAALDKCLSFSQQGVSPSPQLLLERARSCAWKFSAFADTEFSTKKKKEGAAFDTPVDCSHSDHNISCWMDHTVSHLMTILATLTLTI